MTLFRKLYDWVMSWAQSPYGSLALFLLAFCESSFFPIPADALLIALCISRSKSSFRFGLICSVGSVMGGVFGYLIGIEFMEILGYPILKFYGAMGKYHYIQELYNKYDAIAVFTAGFTPIPYKVFTIAAGAFKINFFVFLIASILGRSARFFLVSSLIYIFGERIKSFIDRYFNILTIIFFILLFLGFLIFGWIV